ncbi:DUF2333 family protein [Reinekea sp. SSH23]|uniref:DUF2333 family protein n=1 Tax=Reinekea thalattae TaxID=2593301 RepID=A0A5C8Z432_9GAMM|nr:DUF2333 family protein [Reinekea thalattae]
MNAKLEQLWQSIREKIKFGRPSWMTVKASKGWKKPIGYSLIVILIIWVALAIYWSQEPKYQDVVSLAQRSVEQQGQTMVVGYTTAFTLKHLTDTLLNKPGGYLSNDVMPPSVFLDNMPNWEFGVVIQLRDLSRALRKDMSRSQSQSTEDVDLVEAEPLYHFNNDSWILPATEGEYRKAARYIDQYLQRLADPVEGDAQFYARADNLSSWLKDVETRLGSLSQRLSASVGQTRYNTDLAGERNASQSTPVSEQAQVKTPRFEVDNIFYEARGYSWALIHVLRAIEVDFADVLEDKTALVSLQQIIRELESTQETVWSPFIMNGSGFGMLANHSLVMANYISRANAAIIDLRELLDKG